jgi:hypothetical protein
MTTSDLMPALTLLEATNRIQRPEVKQNTPRPGRLAKGADVWHSMNGAVPTVDVAEDTPDDVPEAAEDEAVDAH